MGIASPLVAFVCEANVCRSRVAEVLVRRGLADSGLTSDIRVISAGTRARVDAGPCEWISGNIGASADERTALGDRPQQVRVELLDEATAIFAADRHVQSALIRMAPSLRDHIFTVKEAAALARIVLDASDVGAAPAGSGIAGLWDDDDSDSELSYPDFGDHDLTWLVGEMDAARGWLPVEQEVRRRFRRARTWSKLLDVPDAHSHTDDRIRHSVMFAELEPAVDSLLASVTSVLRASEMPA